jgi:xanthine dehydrogenase accessory factor
VKRVLLDALLAARTAGQSAALITHLESGDQALVSAGAVSGDAMLAAEVSEQVTTLLAADRSELLETGRGEVFVLVLSPPLRLIIIGAVHIAQALVPMARLAGYAVTIVDPRRAFATEERFPDVELSHDWPDEALERLAPDPGTAVVTLTHDPKLDEPALEVALRSEAFYIGSLGSRKTHAARLDIGAQSPAEIAISIIAQMTDVLRRGSRAD